MSSRLDIDKYQSSSPKQLNGFPRPSLLLKRALGSRSSRITPKISVSGPRRAETRLLDAKSRTVTAESRSSRLRSEKYICAPLGTDLGNPAPTGVRLRLQHESLASPSRSSVESESAYRGVKVNTSNCIANRH